MLSFFGSCYCRYLRKGGCGDGKNYLALGEDMRIFSALIKFLQSSDMKFGLSSKFSVKEKKKNWNWIHLRGLFSQWNGILKTFSNFTFEFNRKKPSSVLSEKNLSPVKLRIVNNVTLVFLGKILLPLKSIKLKQKVSANLRE